MQGTAAGLTLRAEVTCGRSRGAPAWRPGEELHALDYLVYAYLQLGRNDDAQRLLRMAADHEDAADKHSVTPGAGIARRSFDGNA
jgi:hypothetical protein